MSSRYQADQLSIDGVPIVRLQDLESDLTVSIVPSHGNIAFELLHAGQNWLYSPYNSPKQMAGDTQLFGVPLLAPWANRLSSDKYCVNGAEYHLNRSTGNLRLDKSGFSIHGLVLFSAWKVMKVHADADGAEVTSALRFTEYPQWLAHYPFAHRLEMTHRLCHGKLHVRLFLHSECAQPIPVTVGFHPYFRLPTGRRDAWEIDCPARVRLPVSDVHIPLGTQEPVDFGSGVSLNGIEFDDVFTDLRRDASGFAIFEASHEQSAIRVGFGPHYLVAVLYAPPGKDFLCFEPMAAPTDALHLAAEGKCEPLQTVAPGRVWTEEFWIEPRMIPADSYAEIS